MDSEEQLSLTNVDFEHMDVLGVTMWLESKGFAEQVVKAFAGRFKNFN